MDVQTNLTSLIIPIHILTDTGTPKDGLVYNTSGLAASYKRNTSSSAVDITLVDMTLGTWVSGGFKEVDSTKQKGTYELGIPNAALTSGADFVTIQLYGVSGCVFTPLRIDLQEYASQVRAELATELGRLDAAMTTRMAAVGNQNRRIMVVSKLGSDSNSGRPVGPFINEVTDAKLTITSAIEECAIGDTLLIYPGTYLESLTLGVGSHITIQGFGRNRTILAPTIGNAFSIPSSGGQATFNDLGFQPTAGACCTLYESGSLGQVFNRCGFIAPNNYQSLEISIQPTVTYRYRTQFNDCYFEGGPNVVDIIGHTLSDPILAGGIVFDRCDFISHSHSITGVSTCVNVGSSYPVVFDNCNIRVYNESTLNTDSVLIGFSTNATYTVADQPGPIFRNGSIVCVGTGGFLGNVYGVFGYTGNFINSVFVARNDTDPEKQFDVKIGASAYALNIRLVNCIYRTSDLPAGSNIDQFCRTAIQPQPKT